LTLVALTLLLFDVKVGFLNSPAVVAERVLAKYPYDY